MLPPDATSDKFNRSQEFLEFERSGSFKGQQDN
jgi:hypothetical protein